MGSIETSTNVTLRWSRCFSAILWFAAIEGWALGCVKHVYRASPASASWGAILRGVSVNWVTRHHVSPRHYSAYAPKFESKEIHNPARRDLMPQSSRVYQDTDLIPEARMSGFLELQGEMLEALASNLEAMASNTNESSAMPVSMVRKSKSDQRQTCWFHARDSDIYFGALERSWE